MTRRLPGPLKSLTAWYLGNPGVATIDGWRRQALVRGLLAGPCPRGHAGPGKPCRNPGGAIVILAPGVTACPARITAAVKSGLVSRDQVRAQFGEEAPGWL